MEKKTPKKFIETHDPAFTQLAKEVAVAIARNKDGSSQREQVAELCSAELAFKEAVLKRKKISKEIYKRFIQLIRIENNNILSARPYFRETGEVFSAHITPALKARDPEALKNFSINYHFVRFAKDNWYGLWGEEMDKHFNRVHRARTVLIENNMPLAINRAKLFFKKTPKGHLTFMDMIEIASMGLAACVDKYVGEYKANYIGVAIGRIVGNLIDAYSETTMHFFPSDRRVLYRANSIRGRQGITDLKDLTRKVNESFDVDLAEGRSAPNKVTQDELSRLLGAASMVSADSNVGEDGHGVYSFTPDERENPEQAFVNNEETSAVSRNIRRLSVIQQKILRLKGIEL